MCPAGTKALRMDPGDESRIQTVKACRAAGEDFFRTWNGLSNTRRESLTEAVGKQPFPESLMVCEQDSENEGDNDDPLRIEAGPAAHAA